MLRIRDDKPLHEADTMQSLEALLALQQGSEAPPEPASGSLSAGDSGIDVSAP
jgi:hypothetical protein